MFCSCSPLSSFAVDYYFLETVPSSSLIFNALPLMLLSSTSKRFLPNYYYSIFPKLLVQSIVLSTSWFPSSRLYAISSNLIVMVDRLKCSCNNLHILSVYCFCALIAFLIVLMGFECDYFCSMWLTQVWKVQQ